MNEKVLFLIFVIVFSIWQFNSLSDGEGSKAGCLIFVVLALIFAIWSMS
jgi:hypothetical protein